jgi:hypothetical protein
VTKQLSTALLLLLLLPAEDNLFYRSVVFVDHF